MKKIKTNIKGLIILKGKTFYDARGFLRETFKKKIIKKNLILVGALSYLFLFGQTFFWYQLMKSGKFVSTNSYFSSFYF